MRPVDTGTKPENYSEAYQDFRRTLISRIGEYCSYCETPVGANLAVEHILSKSEMKNPQQWENLILACVNCNSRKSNQTNEDSLLKNTCLFPAFVYPPPDNSFNTFSVFKYQKAPRTLSDLQKDEIWSPRGFEVKAPYLNDAIDMVWVTVDTSVAATPGQVAQAQNTIRLVGLNGYVDPTVYPDTIDLRVYNRTQAWQTATAAAAALNDLFARYTGSPDAVGLSGTIISFKSQVKSLAVASGFWSVWMTVFRQPAYPFLNSATKQELLLDLFGPAAFPGTRVWPYFEVS